MATIDPNSATGQSQNANTLLASYFNDLYKYLADTTGSVTAPDFSSVSDGFDYSELLRMATVRAGDAASYESGAAVENVNTMVAITREFTMRQKTKVDYYADGGIDAMNESNFYAAMKSFWVGMLNGNYKEGTTS